MPQSSLVLNIETDLSDEEAAPFLCGIHAAAIELQVEELQLNLSMFKDMTLMAESMERLVPGVPFEQSAAKNGYYGLIGSDVIFWNFLNSRDNPDFDFVFRVGAHELFHAVQTSLIDGGSLGDFPAWLIEGAAEFFALGMLEKYGYLEHLERWTTFGKVFALNYVNDPGRLATWETSGPYGEGKAPYLNYPLVAEIVGRLASMSSNEAVLRDFWREKSTQETWQVTFERVFGLSVQEFYEIIDSEYSASQS